MSRIAIMPHHVGSVLNAGMAVARRLAARGHQVHLVGMEDIEDRVRQQGFDFTPVLGKAFPKGAVEEMENRTKDYKLPPFKEMVEMERKGIEVLCRGEIARALEPLRPDLVLGCSDWPEALIGAWPLGVPVAAYHTKPYSLEEMGEPPITTSLVPEPTRGFRIKNFLAWRAARWPRSFIFKIIMDWDFEEARRLLARTCGFPEERLDFGIDFGMLRLRIPHLVLFPRALEFDRQAEPEDVYYVEPSADLERVEAAPFPWGELDASKPLVYCSMGVTGTTIFPERLDQVFGAFLGAMATRPQWQGVLSVGKHQDRSRLQVPPNVRVYERVPQIELLRRAALFVTQGGALSIAEAASLGTPVVLVPLFFDQGAIAARVVKRQVGLKVDANELKAQLGPALDAAMADRSMKERAGKLAETLAELRRKQVTAEVVEALIRQGRPPARLQAAG